MTGVESKENRVQVLLGLAIIVVLAIVLFSVILVVNRTASTLPESAIPQQLSKRDCPYGLASSYSNDLKIRCYSFNASAGFEKDSDTSFVLPLAVISPRRLNNEVNTAPVVLIPGGPGDGQQTRMQSLSYWAERAIEIGLNRDLVLYDPRGVGDSQPAWDCQPFNQYSIDVLSQNISFTAELDGSGEVLSSCFDAMNDFYRAMSPKALGLFSSRYQAQDVNQMMRALGYGRWHLWGTSYGTRVALLAAEDLEVDSLILDSVYPPGRGSADGWAMLQQHALALHRLHYQKFIHGKAAHKPLFDTLWLKAQAAIPKEGLQGTFSTWSEQSRSQRLVLNDHRLYGLLFYVLYDEELLPTFYRGLQALAQSDNSQDVPIDLRVPIESFLTSGLDARFNAMAYFATECSDNKKVDESSFLNSVAQANLPDKVAQWLTIEWSRDICGHSAFNESAFLSPLVSIEKPVLILSGQIDPITPSSYAQEIYDYSSEASLVSFPGSGHAITNSEDCALDLIREFMQHGAATKMHCDGAEIKTKLEQSGLESTVNSLSLSATTLNKTNSAEEPSMSDPIWIDVRTPEEYADGHYPNSINIPYELIADQIEGVTTDKDATIYVYCRSGKRSGVAQNSLSAIGYAQVENKGGLSDVMPN